MESLLELRPDGAVTAHGVVSADKIIVTTHFPFFNKHGSAYRKAVKDNPKAPIPGKLVDPAAKSKDGKAPDAPGDGESIFVMAFDEFLQDGHIIAQFIYKTGVNISAVLHKGI